MTGTVRNPYRPEKLEEILSEFAPSPSPDYDDDVERALFLAKWLQTNALRQTKPLEKRRYDELAKIAESPDDKATLIQMTDQVFRSLRPEREAEQLIHILDKRGIPCFFGSIETALFKIFQTLGPCMPGIAMPLIKEGMQRETADIILRAEKKELHSYLKRRVDAGLRVNLNFLGEAILGEREANRRFDAYIDALTWPCVEVVSIKISTIFSQISSIEREGTISTLCDRLETLYNVADKEKFIDRSGRAVSRFVYLDMEEYTDMHLTAEAFMRALDRKGLENVRAGVALQAYIPDSFTLQKEITSWAKERVRSGKAPVTIRLVKGANLEMERVIASTRGWPQAPFTSKVETDANFKKMLLEGIKPENIESVHLGVASHNVFDLSYAIIMAKKHNSLARVQFEMLEGMANPLRRALGELVPNILLYAPACKKESFISSIGYLVRRLDENTGPQNFLRYAFNMEPGSPAWKLMKQGFLDSLKKIPDLSSSPRRTQNRQGMRGTTIVTTRFTNEPDTDFSLPVNSGWAHEIMEKWRVLHGERATLAPLVIDGEVVWKRRGVLNSYDPSRPETVVCRYQSADKKSVTEAISAARSNKKEWAEMPLSERNNILKNVADEIRRSRGDLIGASIADAGKTFMEADSEVSEAIDFVEFYTLSSSRFSNLNSVKAKGAGVTVVISPWNFPVAIPCGGVSAALSSGNSVILKPSSLSVLPAWILCNCFWKAGISQKTLQFLPCPGDIANEKLVGSRSIDAIILTGATETARSILHKWPNARLSAETGGKNATLVTALSDRDQAVKNIIHSAFSHSGQKCSATSLLILEEEVYEDPDFKNTLTDAVQSLEVGSSWNLKTSVGPLISPPAGKLKRGIKELEASEYWAVRPENMETNPHLYSPGVKWSVQPGSFSHMTELFGPVLGVMKSKNLNSAVRVINQTGYGLTSAIETLDVREQKSWRNSIKAGNLYINRPTTGAIVLRQPFGGTGKSSTGPGFKAGGPNYVAQFFDFSEPSQPSLPDTPEEDGNLLNKVKKIFKQGKGETKQDENRVYQAIKSYHAARHSEFMKTHDKVKILGEDNLRKYTPVKKLCIRVTAHDTLFENFSRISAAIISGCQTTVSISPETENETTMLIEKLSSDPDLSVSVRVENDSSLSTNIEEKKIERVRYAARGRVPLEIRNSAIKMNIFIADAPVMMEGRLELLWYCVESSLSSVYHRYGNLGATRTGLL